MKSPFYTVFLLILISLQLSTAQGQKPKQPEAETEFSKFLIQYIPTKYPGSSFEPHNDWFQIFIPEYELTVSWGMVPQPKFELKNLEGLLEKKSIFIAKEKKSDWLENTRVKYYSNSGYQISEYTAATMGEYEIGQLTIIQFDGNAKPFVEKMTLAYEKNETKSEQEFVNWLKKYVKATYPSHKVDFHGAWYQSVIPHQGLTVTWGTMDKPKMALKDLHGVREDKTFFIDNTQKTDWLKQPSVVFLKGTGYFLTKYNAAAMGDFEVGDQCVIQFNGDATKFVKQMAKDWKKTK
jgi:hypothetical protein